ncbi:beta-mannosidase [Celeribacter sp.]|uniref:beta-mannosidase n=1 Tax=Celeribacter sp. TaxID=1890673 RepID=UPI003A8D0086
MSYPLNLHNNWNFRDDAGEYSVPVTLPFDAVSALHAAGKIADPYWGRNEYDLRWIAERDWVATSTFTLEETGVELLVEGLDGVVEVFVNGMRILEADNAFRTWRLDLSEVARVGENDIELRFRSIVSEANARQAAQQWHIPGIADREDGTVPIKNGNMVRKPQCDFGWDWNIALAPFGVTGGLSIEPKKAARLDHVMVEQQHHDIESDSVTVIVTAHIAGDAEGDTVEMAFGGRTREVQVAGRLAQAKFFVEVPEFWWPAGQGMQPLYDLEVRLAEDVIEKRIGLRQIELVTQEDDHGLGFKFRVNGRDVFAKGANWIPADALSGRIDREAVRDQLQSAVDANMNMIRVWGGGRYEPTWFYDMCDEMGLMVWQDFMFSCNLYPSDEAFLENVEQEVRENVRRMHHHACLALWCGDNELVGALTWFKESIENRDLYLIMYDRLNRTLQTTLKEVDPTANWWFSSPSSGPLNFGDAWHDDSSGDMHFWSVWHENREFAHYRDVRPRFCSEFGFQSYPSNNVIESFCGPEDRNIAAPVLESHQKNVGGNERIAATMFRYFRFPVDFENFVYLSQVQQGLAIKTAVSWWRSLKPHCMGTLIWQLNDTWPVCSWASLDYGGGWKLLHHMAEKFYAPVLVTVAPEEGKDVFKVINDGAENVDVAVQVAAVNMAGQTRPLADATISAWPTKALELLSLEQDLLADDEVYAFTWQAMDEDGEVTHGGDIYAPKPWKAYDLLAPKIAHDVKAVEGGYEITLTAQALALYVSLEASVAGRFSTNAFTILPGQEVKVIFTPKDTETTPEFTIRDLHSATYGDAK